MPNKLLLLLDCIKDMLKTFKRRKTILGKLSKNYIFLKNFTGKSRTEISIKSSWSILERGLFANEESALNNIKGHKKVTGTNFKLKCIKK